MAGGWRGVAAGALALAALETLLQPAAAGRAGSLFSLPGDWAHRFLDPTVPALHKKAGGPGGAAAPVGSSQGLFTLLGRGLPGSTPAPPPGSAAAALPGAPGNGFDPTSGQYLFGGAPLPGAFGNLAGTGAIAGGSGAN